MRTESKRDRSRVRSWAARHGCEVQVQAGGSWYTIEVLAPAGQRFEEGVHALVEQACAGGFEGLAWEVMMERLTTAKLETCDTSGCEWCHDEGAGR